MKNVVVDKLKNHHITTIIAGDKSKPKMVLVHGYGGSGTLFYRVIKGLTKNFHVIAIDMIGMGLSS